jgi:outer membrane protein assembly factor BamB
MAICPALLAGLVIACIGTANAQEWTRFRGPNGTGVSPSKSIPTQLSEKNLQWKVQLPGTGHSSAVVWGEKVFLTTTSDKGGGISALCLNAKDGKMAWKHDFKLSPFPHHKFNSFAASTPAVDAERVYVVWNEPEHFWLAALDHKGKVIWQRDFGPFVSQHGCGVSPIVYGGMVILGNEQDSQKSVKESPRDGVSSIIAVDALTGSDRWQLPRRSVVVAYSTPCIYEPKGGQPALIFNSQAHGIYAVAPDSGKVLWEFDQAFDKRSVSSPIIAGNVIFGSCGSGGGGNYITAVKVGEGKAAKPVELAYQMKRSAPYVPTGVSVGDLVWLISDAGVLSCLHAPTGEVRYQERVGGDFFGSMIWAGGRLFAVSTKGELVVAEASEKFNVLHRFDLKETCHSTPSIAGDRLYVRTEGHLWSFGGK